MLAFVEDFANRYTLVQTRNSSAGAAGDGTILTTMPGRIIAVEVAIGDAVIKARSVFRTRQ